MGGLKHLLFRLIPIMTLICFVCFGITYTFQTGNENNITYLTAAYYDKSNNFQIIENATEEQKNAETTLVAYEFDFTSYRENINQDILKRSISKTFDLDTYKNNLSTFKAIWADGYDFLDGIQTIINAVILTINTIILPINILLIPIRIISGLLLTGMSLIGININNGIIICPILSTLTDELAIPLIPPTYNPNYQATTNDTYRFKDDMPQKYKSYWTSIVTGQLVYHYTDFNITFDFKSSSQGVYQRIFTDYIIENGEYHFKVWYEDTQNYQILVYDNEWLYTDAQTITITNIDTSNENLVQELNTFLNNAIKQN